MKASISKRWAFLIESAFMMANNLLFIVLWAIFFRQFYDVAGWNYHDLVLLMAIGTGSYGLMQVAFGGVRNLSKMIIDGDLDPLHDPAKKSPSARSGIEVPFEGVGTSPHGHSVDVFGQRDESLYTAFSFIGFDLWMLVFTSNNIICPIPSPFGSVPWRE